MKPLILISIILLLFSCTKIDTLQPLGENALASPFPKDSAGQIMVKFKNDNPDPALIARYGGKIKSKVKTKAMEKSNDPGFLVISVTQVNAAVKGMLNSGKVEWAEVDIVVKHMGFTDPGLSSLWGMNKINAPAVWESGNTGDQQIFVGVIDEGIMHWHQDLCGQVWVNRYDPVDGIDNDGNGYIDDLNGWDFKNNNNTVYDNSDKHGTHVSGIIGAKANGVGVVGVAPNVTLISGKFLEDFGNISDAVRAIDYMTDLKIRHKMNIITNHSWGGGGTSQALTDAFSRAEQADILAVVAAGNNGVNLDLYPLDQNIIPASINLPNILVVAAIDENDNLASFSNYGPVLVDIAAPGVNINSTVSYAGLTNLYSSYNGTSMATPHVTGAAVLYKAKNPSANYLQIKNALMSLARPVIGLTGKVGSGSVLDVSSFIGPVNGVTTDRVCTVPDYDKNPPSTPTNLTAVHINTTSVSFSWSPSFDIEGPIWSYYLSVFREDGSGLINYMLNDPPNLIDNVGTVYGLPENTVLLFSIAAIDGFRNFSSWSDRITVKTGSGVIEPPPPPPPVDNRGISLSATAAGRIHTLRWAVTGTPAPQNIVIRNNGGVIATLPGSQITYTTTATKRGGSVTYTATAVYTDKQITSNPVTLRINK